MKNTIFTIGTLLIALISPTLVYSSSIEGSCGGTNYVVKISEPGDYETAKYRIYFKSKDNEDKLLYQAYTDRVYAACVEGYDRHKYLLLEIICHGSGCSDTGEYRIIDAETNKILLDEKPTTAKEKADAGPDDGSKMYFGIVRFNHEKQNYKDAKKILGYNPPEIRDIDRFCCNK